MREPQQKCVDSSRIEHYLDLPGTGGTCFYEPSFTHGVLAGVIQAAVLNSFIGHGRLRAGEQVRAHNIRIGLTKVARAIHDAPGPEVSRTRFDVISDHILLEAIRFDTVPVL